MSNLDDIRARMLREALSGSKHHDKKPGYFSTIYPAFADGPLAPHTMQLPVDGIPEGTPEDDELVDELDDDDESKEKKAKEEADAFVQRCIAAITNCESDGSAEEAEEAEPEQKPESDKARFLKAVRSIKKKGHG